MFDEILLKIENEYNAANAYSLTASIHSYDRWSTFSQYQRCARFCAERMREYGLEQIELIEIPADGETTFGDWAMPMAWDVEDATLEIVTPEGDARILAHYRDEPASLAMWSAPTPANGLEAQVVLVKDEADLEGDLAIDVADKIIFTSKHAAQAHKWAVAHGACGVISDFPGCEVDALAHGVCWVNAWVDHQGWGHLKGDTHSHQPKLASGIDWSS